MLDDRIEASVRTSGSLFIISNSCWLDAVGDVSFLRNSGPVNHDDAISCLAGLPRVAISAGLLFVSTYVHCEGLDMLRII